MQPNRSLIVFASLYVHGYNLMLPGQALLPRHRNDGFRSLYYAVTAAANSLSNIALTWSLVCMLEVAFTTLPFL
jgi:hypothetical protein